MAIGVAIGAMAALVSLLNQNKGRRYAKKANKEQAKRDALMNLISVAGGGGTTGMAQAQPVPQVNYGGALSTLGNIVQDTEDRGVASEYAAYNRDRQAKLDANAMEKQKALEELQKARIDAYNRSGGGSSSSDPWAIYRERTL